MKGPKLGNILKYILSELKIFGLMWLQMMSWFLIFLGAVLLIQHFAGFDTTTGKVLLILLIPCGLIVFLLMLVKFDLKSRAAAEKRRKNSNESEI